MTHSHTISQQDKQSCVRPLTRPSPTQNYRTAGLEPTFSCLSGCPFSPFCLDFENFILIHSLRVSVRSANHSLRRAYTSDNKRSYCHTCCEQQPPFPTLAQDVLRLCDVSTCVVLEFVLNVVPSVRSTNNRVEIWISSSIALFSSQPYSYPYP